MSVGLGIVAGAALSALGSLFSSGGSKEQTRRVNYVPVKLRTKDGTIVTMYQPVGETTSGGGSSTSQTIGTALQAAGDATTAYSTASARGADKTKPATAAQKNAAANSAISDVGSGMDAMNQGLRLKSDVYRGVDNDQFFNSTNDVDPLLNTRDPFSLRY